MINALNASLEPPTANWTRPRHAAAATPARVRLGGIAPDMMRLDGEVKQITHAIRMAAYNTETTLARNLNGHYARAEDEAYALIRLQRIRAAGVRAIRFAIVGDAGPEWHRSWPDAGTSWPCCRRLPGGSTSAR